MTPAPRRPAPDNPSEEPRSGVVVPRKASWKPGTMMAPLPVVLVTVRSPDGPANILTIAWTGIVCTTPPMLYVSMTRERHSFDVLSATGEFVVNIPTRKIARAVDLCGVTSGRSEDKFAKARLTQAEGEKVRAPVIVECPVNLECRVKKTLNLGSHTMFIAEILNVRVDEALLDKHGRLALERAGLIAFAHGHYYEIGKQIGHFGFSVRKKIPGKKPQATGASTSRGSAGTPRPPRPRSGGEMARKPIPKPGRAPKRPKKP
jgi:flavin reductase (DIM6/NTAB) family NADH-FMN oxidoreductase RutF